MDQIPNSAQASSANATFNCPCGTSAKTREEIEAHSFQCLEMQKEGLSQFVQVLTGIMRNTESQIPDADKMGALKSIFAIMTKPAEPVSKPVKQSQPVQPEENKYPDMDMIDSNVNKPKPADEEMK